MSKPKPVNFELIEHEPPSEVYQIIDDAVSKWHPNLAKANIIAAWNIGWKPDLDGKITLGECKKASDFNKELMEYDFCILLNKQYWEEFSHAQKVALIDHELSHAAVSTDKDGNVRCDDRGRILYRTRRHDTEEFRSVIRRHGLYKSDLEAFAQAIEDSKEADLFKPSKEESQITITTGNHSVTMTDKEFANTAEILTQ